jgi:hypothetical protein
MTSSVTPDWAWRPSRSAAEPAWRLSWAAEPSELCTREAARAALEHRERLHRDLDPEPAAERDEHHSTLVPRAIRALRLRMLDRRHS